MEQLIAILTKPDNVPIVLMLFLMPFFTWLSYSQAFANDRKMEQGMSPAEAVLGPEIDLPQKVHTWPFLLKIEFLAAIGCLIFLMVWSMALNAPLEEPANSAITPNPSKAPWYFLGLQEILVYFDPWIAGVALPGVILGGLAAIPYLDVNPKGSGYYCHKDRWFAISCFNFGFLVLWCPMIVIGTLMRGPGWMMFMLGEKWDPHKVVAEVNIDLPNLLFGVTSESHAGMLIGASFIGLWFVAWMVIPYVWMRIKDSRILKDLGIARYMVTNLLFSSMMFVVLKIFLRLAFSVKYILVTEYFKV